MPCKRYKTKLQTCVATRIQRTQYYPSGLPWAYQAGDGASVQPYKHNGKEFIETHGYDVTDHGNRTVYHAINRYTTIDRFAEKYPWQSPYAHAGNNPVNFVDVGGDSIWTVIGGERHYYGQDANSNYGFVGSDGNLYTGKNSYTKNLTKALDKLQSKETGRELVSFLAGDGGNVTIFDGQNNRASVDGTTIEWNHSNSNPDFPRPGFVGLGHEMAHTQDAWNGTLDMSTWTTVNVTDASNSIRNIPNAEKQALHVENQLRREHGFRLRTHYVRGYTNTQFIKNGASMFHFRNTQHTIRIVEGIPITTIIRIPFKY